MRTEGRKKSMPSTQSMSKRIGEHLLHKELITQKQLQTAMEKQKLSGSPLGEILVADGVLTEQQVIEALSEQLGVPFMDVESYELEEDILGLFPQKFLREHLSIPLFRVNQTVTVAMADPLDVRTIDRLRFLVGCEIEPVFGVPSAIQKMLDRHYGAAEPMEDVIKQVKAGIAPPQKSGASSDKFATAAQPTRQQPASAHQDGSSISSASERLGEGLAAAAEKAPIIQLVETILKQGVNNRASDIHLEPEEQACYLRYRIDGILYDVPPPPKQLEAAIISRLKIMANLDIAERRLPQDGRFQVKFDAHEVDFRLSTFPTIYGENIAIRVLDKRSVMLTLEQIGFLPDILARFEHLIARPNGIILVTGPTGCGKTTTLYGALRTVDAVQRNVITLEDPVEYRIARIRQSQIDVKAGLTFANGLRSIVRQDPDVIMIGEIRDLETAEIAIHAALTGHLVFSTLHTNDAPGAITRLIDMGVEPFLVASSVIGVVAQRLVRTLCPECKQRYEPSPEALASLELKALPKSATLANTKGCGECKQVGYRGRSGIFELLEMTQAMRELTIHKASSAQLATQAVQDGMVSLRQAGFAKVLSGLTTIEEILRITERSFATL